MKERVEAIRRILDEKKAIKDAGLMKKSLVMIVLVAAGFVLHGQIGIESSVIALSAAAVMFVIGRQREGTRPFLPVPSVPPSV